MDDRSTDDEKRHGWWWKPKPKPEPTPTPDPNIPEPGPITAVNWLKALQILRNTNLNLFLRYFPLWIVILAALITGLATWGVLILVGISKLINIAIK